MPNRVPLLLVPTVLLLAIGCGPPWHVIRQSGPPSALAGQTTIGVTFDWSRVLLGGLPEQVWLANQPPNDQQSYMEVRNAIMESFTAELQRQLAPSGITVVPTTGQEPVVLSVQPLLLEMGFYRVMVNRDSRLDSALVFYVGGQETDHIEVRTRRVANLANPTILGRMVHCAQNTAQLAAEFVRRAQ
jgi:hypothetical protein